MEQGPDNSRLLIGVVHDVSAPHTQVTVIAEAC